MATRMKALVYDYDVAVREQPLPPIPRGWVLVKVYGAVWSGLEEAISAGILWAKPGTIMGHAGYGMVVEVGVGAPKWLVGKKVAVGRLPAPYTITPYDKQLWALIDEVSSLPGILYDGWLAEYVSLPSSAVTEISLELSDEKLYALATPAAIAAMAAHWLATSAKGTRYAVIGAGFVGILTALAAKEFYGVEVEVYSSTNTWVHLCRELGLAVKHVKQLSEPSRAFDAIFIATLNYYDAFKGVESVKRDGDILLHPIYSYAKPPTLPRCCYHLISNFPADSGVVLLRRLSREIIEKLVGFIDGLEKPPIPRPKPILILRPTLP